PPPAAATPKNPPVSPFVRGDEDRRPAALESRCPWFTPHPFLRPAILEDLGSMSQQSPPPSSSPSLSWADELNSAMRTTDEQERRECLLRLLGEPVCRHLGIYHIPDDLVLSVVIPV